MVRKEQAKGQGIIAPSKSDQRKDHGAVRYSDQHFFQLSRNGITGRGWGVFVAALVVLGIFALVIFGVIDLSATSEWLGALQNHTLAIVDQGASVAG